MVETSFESHKGLEKTLQAKLREWALKGNHPIHKEEIESIASTAATGKYASKGLGATLPQLSRHIELVASDGSKLVDVTPENRDGTLDERLGLTIGGRFSVNKIHSNIGFIEAARSFGSCTLADKIAMHLAANILYLQHGITLIRNTGEGGALPWELFGKPEHREYLTERQKKEMYDFTSKILDFSHIYFDSPDLKEQFIEMLYQRHYPIIMQAASGMFWNDPLYLLLADAIEMKIGQGAKIGHGGLLPGRKVNKYVAWLRGIIEGIDAYSPARMLNNLGPENNTGYLRDLREVSEWKQPIIVKVGASHVDSDTEIAIKSYADAIAIDGLTGGTGASPRKVQNEIGINTEAAIVLARRAAENFFASSGYDERFKIIISGGINDFDQMLKARALGGDGTSHGTAFMAAANCVYAMTCDKMCQLGITTNPELYPIIDNTFNIVNFVLAQAYKQNEVVNRLGGLPTRANLRTGRAFPSALADIAMHDGVTYHDKVLAKAESLVSSYSGGNHVKE